MIYRLIISGKKHLFDNRGVALIVVILMVSVIVSITLELNRSARDDLYETANLSDGIKLYYIAKSGFYGGEAVLLQDINNYDAFTEDWAKMELLSPQSEAFFRQGSFQVRIEDETGKIPLNKLISGNDYNVPVRELLLRFLSLPEFGLGQDRINEIVDSLKDWLDADDAVTTSGAENAYYRGLPKPYSPKNGFLDCIDELLMVKGITKELYYGTKETPALKDYVSVYGEGLININTAPKLVLRALSKDISVDGADLMDEYRMKEGNNLADVSWYRKIQSLQNITMGYGALSVKSNYFTIISTGYLGKMRETLTGSIKKGQGPGSAELLSWNVQ